MLIEEIQKICLEYKNKHRGLKTLQFKIRNTAFETYGGAAIDKTNKGACLPEQTRVYIVAKNHASKADVLRTLNHEVYGHIGILNLSQKEKTQFLESIKSLKETELKREWGMINAHYQEMSEDEKAEEVYALIAEEIDNNLTMVESLNVNVSSKKEVQQVAHFLKNQMLMGFNKRITFNKPNTLKYSKGDNVPEKKPTYEEKIASEIIQALEDGTAPWVKPWKGESLSKMAPFNPTTGKQYNGINFVNLSLKTMTTGDPRWMTYKQAKAFGGQVKKGESGTTIQYWKFNEQIDKVDEAGNKVLDAAGKPVKINVRLENPKVFYATVFNGSQINDLPPLQEQLDSKELLTDFAPNEAAEKILANSGAVIHHKDGNRAFYASRLDEITLPHKEQFNSESEYYATALHELGHWTGHESRLNRKMGNSFGSELYAKEELRAEIASFMLSSQIGIDFDPSNHHAYINSWVQVLEDTPREIFKACSDAGKITSFITNLQEQSLTKETNHQAGVNEYEHMTLQEVEELIVAQQIGMAQAGGMISNPEVQKEIESELQVLLDAKVKIKAQNLIDKLMYGGMDITKIDFIEAEELIKTFGSIQEQSPYGSTHTELDLGPAGKVMLVQRDDNGEVHTSAALRADWTNDFFTNKETTGMSKIITDKNQMIALNKNYLLIEVRKELNSGVRGAELSEYIKPLAMSSTCPIKEVTDTLYWVNSSLHKRGNEGGSVLNTLQTLATTLESIYESRTTPQTLEAALENTLEQGNPYDLEDGYVIMENFVGDAPENKKSEGLYLFAVDENDLRLKPESPISHEEARAMIQNHFNPNSENFTVLNEFKTQISSIKESETKIGDTSLSSLSKEELIEKIDIYFKEVSSLENQSQELSYLASVNEKDYVRDFQKENIIEMQLRKAQQDFKKLVDYAEYTSSEKIEIDATVYLLRDEIMNNISLDLDHVVNDMNAIFEGLIKGSLDEKGNVVSDSINEATLKDIRNAIIYGQDEILQDKLTEHNIAVISNTVELLKEVENKIESELMKEPTYEKQIMENHQKLKERDKAMDSKQKTQTFTEKTYLAVPYKEKDLAKKAGAKWDVEKKTWYAPEGSSMDALKDWTIDNQEIKQMIGNSAGDTQDAISEFKEALEAQGLIIDGDPIMDGELRRVRVEGDKGAKKSGAYVGYSDGYPAGMIQNYKTNYKENWKSTNGDFSNQLTPEQIAAQKSLNEAKKAERAKEVEQEQEEVSQKVSLEFKEALPADITHPYLVKKEVKPHGLKMDNRSNLVMPLKDINGKHWTSQKINTNFKGFEKGGKKEGCFYIVGADKPSDLKEVIIVEGFATGATIHEATDKPVVVAVDSGNLSHVAEAFHSKYPDKPILIAGDDDIQQEMKSPPKPNGGKIKSNEAAQKVNGLTVLPKFTSEEIEKGATDFNDLATSRGKNVVKTQINTALRRIERLSQSNTKEKAPKKQKEGMSR